jgi:hypothetical protein
MYTTLQIPTTGGAQIKHGAEQTLVARYDDHRVHSLVLLMSCARW